MKKNIRVDVIKKQDLNKLLCMTNDAGLKCLESSWNETEKKGHLTIQIYSTNDYMKLISFGHGIGRSNITCILYGQSYWFL